MNDRPRFNKELFLHNAEEAEMNESDLTMGRILWKTWSESLSRKIVEAEGCRFLAVWLKEDVERAVDAAWADSPSRGFRLNALAQTLCMSAVHESIPEIEEVGCASVPYPTAPLAEALTGEGLPARAGTGMELSRRYAVVTCYPFSGGCDICALNSSCPRAGNRAASSRHEPTDRKKSRHKKPGPKKSSHDKSSHDKSGREVRSSGSPSLAAAPGVGS